MLKKIFMALIVSMGVSVFAVDPHARIDVDGRGKVKIKAGEKPKGGYSVNPAWVKKYKDFYVSTQGARIKKDGWVDYEMSFTPENDGLVYIKLMGIFYKPKGEKKNKPVWVCWDEIVVEGAEMDNGNFEETDEKGKPKGWRIKKDQCISKDGNKYIKTWHNSAAIKELKVKKGQKVTIKAKVKKAEAKK